MGQLDHFIQLKGCRFKNGGCRK